MNNLKGRILGEFEGCQPGDAKVLGRYKGSYKNLGIRHLPCCSDEA